MRKLFIVAACLAVMPAVATAQQGLTGTDRLHYNYVDLRYARLDLPGPGSDPDGFIGEVSGKVADQFFVRGSYMRLSADGGSLDQIIGEGGFIFPMVPGVDLIGTAGVIYVDLEDEDDTSFIVSGGVRALLIPQLEVQGRLLYTDNDFYDEGLDSAFDGEIEARFNFVPEWSVGMSYRIDADLLTVGARYNFGIF